MVLGTKTGFRDRSRGRFLNRQPWMSRYVRVFWLLILSQAVCLAIGLWLESQLVGSLTTVQSHGPLDVPQAGAELQSPKEFASLSENRQAIELSAIVMRVMVFCWIVILQTMAAYLILSLVFAEAATKKMAATGELLKRQKDLVRTRDAVILGLAKLAESRDPETGNHLERIERGTRRRWRRHFSEIRVTNHGSTPDLSN